MANSLTEQYKVLWKISKARTYFSQVRGGSTNTYKINDARTYEIASTSPTKGVASINSMREEFFIMQEGFFSKASGDFYQNSVLSASGAIASTGETAYIQSGDRLLRVTVGALAEANTLNYHYTVSGIVKLVDDFKTIYSHDEMQFVAFETHPIGEGPEGYSSQTNAATKLVKVGDKYTYNQKEFEIARIDKELKSDDQVIQAPYPKDFDPPVKPFIGENEGAYVRFTVTLEKQEVCSQVTINPFTKYPMEIISIKYEEDTETWHEPKELIQYMEKTESAGQLRIAFPSILAKRFTVVVNQKNYERNVYSIDENRFDNKDLWAKIATKEAEVTLNLSDGIDVVKQEDLDSWSGWDIYQQALKKYQGEYLAWEEDVYRYNKEHLQYQQDLGYYTKAMSRYENELSNYRSIPVTTVTEVKTPVGIISTSPSGQQWTHGYRERLVEILKARGSFTNIIYETSYTSSTSYEAPSGPRPQRPNISSPQPPVPVIPKPTFAFRKQRQETKYEYVYGIRDLKIAGEEYSPRSIYVTKPIEVPGNIVELSLTSNETHPLFSELSGESSSRQTSIEYYVAYEETPALEDWHAILPENTKEVQGELLMFKSSSATLRFPAIATKEGLQQARVYKDGVLVNMDKWSFANGGKDIQLLEVYAPTSIYTIDYTPNTDVRNPWVVNIVQDQLKKIRQVDEFPNGTNRNKTITLSKYPYINYEAINNAATYDPNTSSYKPIVVRLKDANIAGLNRTTHKEAMPYDPSVTQAIFTKNTTDYKTGDWKSPRSYSLKADGLYNGFDYWHERNKLYFSETFNRADITENIETNHGNGTIEVEYEYLVSSFRVKIILRRNGPGVNSITPVVNSYALKFKSMN